MFVLLLTYRARPGREEAVVALHEEWERCLRSEVKGYLYGDLLRHPQDPQGFIEVRRFRSDAMLGMDEADIEQEQWHRRLVELIEEEPVCLECVSDWRAGEPQQVGQDADS